MRLTIIIEVSFADEIEDSLCLLNDICLHDDCFGDLINRIESWITNGIKLDALSLMITCRQGTYRRRLISLVNRFRINFYH